MAAERLIRFIIAGDASKFQAAAKQAEASTESLTRSMEEAESQSGSLSSRIGGFFGGIGKAIAAGAAVVGGAIAGIGAAAWTLGEQLDGAYDTIRIGTGATGEALEQLNADFRAVAKQVPVDLETVGSAIADLNTRMGVSGPIAQELATQFLNLSRITGEDVSRLIQSGSRAFADWGISAEEAGGKLDFLFRVSQSTGIGVDRLMQLVTLSGAAMREMGLDFETSAVLLGQFEKAGVNTEQALMGLNRAVATAAREGKPATQAIQELFDAIKNAKDPAEATRIAVETFGTRAGPELASAIRSGRLDVAELTETLKEGGDTINALAAETDDWAQKWQLLKNNVAIAAEPLANTLFGIAGAFADQLIPITTQFFEQVGPQLQTLFTNIGTWLNDSALPALGRFSDWFITTALPAIQGFLSGAWSQVEAAFTTVWTVIDGQVLPALQRFSDWFTGTALPAVQGFAGQIQPLLQPVIEFFSGSFQGIILTVLAAITVAFGAWAISAAAAAAATIAALLPVIAPIAAIGVAVGALKAAWDNNWGGIQDKLRAVWGVIQPIIQAIIDHLARFWQDVQPRLIEAWETIRARIDSVVQVIRTIITTTFDAIRDFINRHRDEITTILQGAWNVIEGIIRTVTAIIEGIIRVALDIISGDWQAAWNDMQQMAQRIWDGIKQVISGALDIVKGVIRTGLEEAQRIWDSIWDGILRKVSEIKNSLSSVVQGLIGDIKGAFSGSINWLWSAGRDIIQGLINGLRSLHIPLPHISVSWSSVGVGPVSVPIPDFSVSWYALGGIALGPAIAGIGEAGPEAIIPLSGRGLEMVRDALGRETDALTITVNIDTVYATDRAAAERAGEDVAYAIAQALRRRGVV